MSESAPCLLLLHLLAGVAVIDDLLRRFARVAVRVRPVAFLLRPLLTTLLLLLLLLQQ